MFWADKFTLKVRKIFSENIKLFPTFVFNLSSVLTFSTSLMTYMTVDFTSWLKFHLEELISTLLLFSKGNPKLL